MTNGNGNGDRPQVERHEWTKDDEPALESFLAALREADAQTSRLALDAVVDAALRFYNRKGS